MEKKLQDLRVGDYVSWSSQYRIGVKTILSITGTHIKTTEGMRYDIDTGELIGGYKWDTSKINILTQDRKYEIVKLIRSWVLDNKKANY